MAILDSFLVEWVLDPSKYLSGQKKLEEANKRTREDVGKTTNDIGQAGKRSAEFFGKLRSEAVGLFLTFQGASSIKSFVSDLVAGDAATGRLAANLNSTTQELSAWQIAVKEAGGQAQEANAAFAALGQLYQNRLNTGVTGQDPVLHALGLMPDDLVKPTTALEKLAEARDRFVQNEGESAGQAHFYGLLKQIGLSDGVINTLSKGRAALDDQISTIKAHSAATDEDARKAAEFEKKWADLSARLANQVRPEIYALVSTLSDVLQSLEDNNLVVPIATGLIVALGLAVAEAASPFIIFGAAITGAVAAINALLAKMPAVTSWLDYIEAPIKNALGPNFSWLFDRPGAAGGSGAAPGTGGGSLTLPGNQRQLDAISRFGGGGGRGVSDVSAYFKRLGYSDAAAEGIAAGVFAESGGNDRNRNPTSGAYGLAQWLTKGRLAAFQARFGHSIQQSTREEQLAFIAYELQNGEAGAGRSIRGARTSSDALLAFVTQYERPGPGALGDLRRGANYLAGRRGGGGSAGGGITINGGITVHTAATDADGIAKTLVPAIRRRAVTTQANRGLD